MHTLKVFTNEKGEYGNPVGIVVDTENKIDKTERQKLATESGFSEIVFVNNLENKEVSIYTPQREIPFAGHAVVGASYFLSHQYNLDIKQLVSIGGPINTWFENNLTWVRCDLSITPNWNYEQLENVESVENLSVNETQNKEHTVVWTWIDKAKGLIRARTFADDWGIPEDEANGSGSMKLAASLNQEITVIHGKGSIIHARPAKNNCGEVGGLVSGSF